MFRKHFTREVYKVCNSYWLWTNEITGIGYYMKPVSDSHSSTWNRILADNEVQLCEPISEQTFIGW